MKQIGFSPHRDVYVQYLKSNQKHNMEVQHYHDAYEIYLQLSDKRYLYYDNICYTLEEGSLAVFEPFDIHYTESREVDYYERYVINFRPEKLSILLSREEINLLLDKIKTGVIQLDKDQIDIVCECFKRVEYYSAKGGFLSEKLLYSTVLQLIMMVIQFTDTDSIAIGEKIAPQVIKAIKYMNKHYNEDINLDSIAEFVHTSKYYFCRLFNSTTGATVIEYLNNIRLTKVHSLLIDTNYTIEGIAQQTGFSSAINLTRTFKKVYGVSPRTFRNSQKNKQ